MIRWYYNKIWASWLNSKSRVKTFNKRDVPPEIEFNFEKKMIYILYTIFMPLVLLEFLISTIIKKIKRSDE